MKRYIIMFASLLLIAACSSNRDVEKEDIVADDDQEEVNLTEQEELVEEVDKVIEVDAKDITNDEPGNESMDVDEVEQLLEYSALGETDKLTELTIDSGEIKAVVEIGDSDFTDDKSMIAETVYSMVGDELLQHDGWEVLTIEFVDIGKVSMNRDEKESNEYGSYFPLEIIMKQLGNL